MRKSRLTEQKQYKLIEQFVAGSTARTAAAIADVNKSTAAYYFQRLRELIYGAVEYDVKFAGEIEVGESCFVGIFKGKGGRCVDDKIHVLGFLDCFKVYTKIIPDTKLSTLVPIIKELVLPGSIFFTDSLPWYYFLDVNNFKHNRINHPELPTDRQSHFYVLEDFWTQAKRQMRKFNGVPKNHFHLYLKECEWRFNNPIPMRQLNMLKKLVKKNMV